MAGDALEVMPMSPRQGPAQLGNAAIQWARSRRGRVLIITAVFMLVFLGLAGARHSETLSSSYQALSSNYHLPSWRPHLPNLPSIITSPLKPSNTTLELENGDIKHVPSHLNKKTPNFHLLMPALEDSPEFCKTTLSAMMLNYPPPTIINLFQSFKSKAEREKARLTSILSYLENEKVVNDEDLLLIVDGRDTWFQLPSEVMIRQYQNVLDDANQRLTDKYAEKFTQTIVFGAQKTCESEDLACKYAPESMLPDDIYGEKTGIETELTPARYLDAGMLMGPAKDLKALYEAAGKVFDEESSQSATVQSVMATIFGEQQMFRNSHKKKPKNPTVSKWLDYFGGSAAEPVPETEEEVANITLQDDKKYEFSVGLDYTHTLFQPLTGCAEDELVPLIHDNSTDLSNYHHDGTPTPPLSIPTALQQARPPFWTPDLSRHNPSPNEKPAYIDKLEFNSDLDELKSRDTPWTDLELIQNTYTGAIPAAFHVHAHFSLADNRRSQIPDPRARRAQSPSITWQSLWYSGYERALLRKYFRTPQSPIGYHKAAVGGDQMWDQRGGRGGVWTEKEALWLPWGEVDGVCGTLKQIKEVFGDGKGVWLHENEGDAEQERLKDEEELNKKIAEAKQKAEEQEKERKEKEAKEKAEKEQKEKEGKVKQNKEKTDKEKQDKVHAEMEKGKADYAEGKDGEQKQDKKSSKADGGRRRRRWAA